MVVVASKEWRESTAQKTQAAAAAATVVMQVNEIIETFKQNNVMLGCQLLLLLLLLLLAPCLIRTECIKNSEQLLNTYSVVRERSPWRR